MQSLWLFNNFKRVFEFSGNRE